MGKKRKERGTISASVRAALSERSGGLCESCGRRANHAHHIQYRSRGGTSALENLANLCLSCHSGVHNGDPLLARFRRHSWEAKPLTKVWKETLVFGRVPKEK